MSDTLLKPQPVPVTIGGRDCHLSYGMHAVVLYQRETARIERSRPRPDNPDPKCACGFRKSQHVGPNLIRLGEKQELLCPRFRAEDPLLGDSLFLFESWLKIDLHVDPERWMACLWCGLHERTSEGKWVAPFTQEDLGGLLGLCVDTRLIGDRMFEALAAWMPKAEKGPNATAPGEPAPQQTLPTSPSSGPAPASATDSLATSS
jgi:hypothetical protein